MNGMGEIATQGYGMDRAAAKGAMLGEAARSPEIRIELERLGRTLKGIDQGLDTLTQRLSESVMRNDPPTPVGGSSNNIAGVRSVPQTAIGSQVAEMVTMAQMLNERVQSITARLEV